MTRFERCRTVYSLDIVTIVDESEMEDFYNQFYAFRRNYWMLIHLSSLSEWLYGRNSLPWNLLIKIYISFFNSPLYMSTKYISFLLEIELWVITSYVMFDIL